MSHLDSHDQRIGELPYRELTHPHPPGVVGEMSFLSIGGICDRSLEGTIVYPDL